MKSPKSEGHVTLSFRLPAPLVKRIDAFAEKEIRNRINMVTVLLTEAVDARDRNAQPEKPAKRS
jgi:hypothetical protein